jgi:hypothetical protein
MSVLGHIRERLRGRRLLQPLYGALYVQALAGMNVGGGGASETHELFLTTSYLAISRQIDRA